MPFPFLPIGMAAQAASSIFGVIQGAKMLKEAKKIKPVYKAYDTSQYAKEMYGGAQLAQNSVNPLMAAQQRGILASQANAMGNVTRNATDAGQALAAGAAAQAQSDNAAFNLGAQNLQWMDANRDRLMKAQEVMIGEDRMKYEDMMKKYMLDTEQKNSLRSAGQQAIVGGLSNLANTALGAQSLQNQRGSQSAGFNQWQSSIVDSSSFAPYGQAYFSRPGAIPGSTKYSKGLNLTPEARKALGLG